jgi:pilus assembly protein CpaF
VVKLSDKLQQAEADGSSGTSSRGRSSRTSRPPAKAKDAGSGSDNGKAASSSKRDTSTAKTAKKTSSSSSSSKGRSSSAPKSDTAQRWASAKKAVREAVLKELAPKVSKGGDAVEGLEDEVTQLVDRMLRQEDLKISVAERRAFVAQMLSDILGYGVLDDLLSDPDVTEVMCNDYDEIWVERDGIVERSDVAFANRDDYRTVIEKIVSAVGRRVDESSPMVDARLPDGSRVNAIVPPLAVHGPCLTIRRFSEDPFTAQDLIGFGSLSDDLALVLEACVRGKLNVLVSGGTATGKTTMLNVLSRFIPEHERIITVEDAAELQLQQPHVVTLEARPANTEGQGQVTIRDLVRNTLRMRPDRIVVGECRGGEALDMLQAMNTGHEGSLTTLHANSPRDALSRLEMLVLMAGVDLPERAIREMIASAIDIIVQITRLPDGSRKVTSVQEIHGMEDRTIVLQELFAYEPNIDARGKYTGVCQPTGLRPRFLDKVKAHGVEVPASVFRPDGAAPRRKAASGSSAARSGASTRGAKGRKR